MKRSVMAATLLLPAALTGCGGGAGDTDPTPESKTFTVWGEILLVDSGVETYGGKCFSSGGFSDIAEGATVLIRDSKDQQVGLGKLSAGQKESSVECRFPFVVHDVPDGDAIYSAEVTHRGQVPFKRSESDSVSLRIS